MTSSYNLRLRQKELSPNSKKQLFKGINDNEKATPKTECKIIDHKQFQQKISKKLVSNSVSTSGSMIELLPSTAVNNQLFNGQPSSNSQIDSAVNIRKNKIQELVIGRHQDNVESALLEQSALHKNFVLQKTIKRHQSSIQIGTDKKQYKTIKHPIPLSIPFRKFQTQLEQKVVSILNKITHQKNCAKQIQKLFSKLSNVSSKDLRNRYFISGIAVLVKIVNSPQSSQIYQPQALQKIMQAYKLLKQKILFELENIQDYQNVEVITTKKIDQGKLIRKVYKILKRKIRKQNRQTLQNKSVDMVKQFTESSGINIKLLFKSVFQI